MKMSKVRSWRRAIDECYLWDLWLLDVLLLTRLTLLYFQLLDWASLHSDVMIENLTRRFPALAC